MKLRYINLQLERAAYDLDYVSDFCYRARFMCNYLSRKVRLLHFETDGTFKMISINLGGTSEIDIVGLDALQVSLPFNKEEYDKLDDKDRIIYFASKFKEGFRLAATYKSIPLDGLYGILADFQTNGFKNTWVAKNTIFREHNLRVILNCDFNQYDFHLNVDIYQWASKKILCSGTVIKTLPDEVFFDHLFKDVYISGEQIVITQFLDFDFIQISLTEAQKRHFVFTFSKCPKELNDKDLWNNRIQKLMHLLSLNI